MFSFRIYVIYGNIFFLHRYISNFQKYFLIIINKTKYHVINVSILFLHVVRSKFILAYVRLFLWYSFTWRRYFIKNIHIWFCLMHFEVKGFWSKRYIDWSFPRWNVCVTFTFMYLWVTVVIMFLDMFQSHHHFHSWFFENIFNNIFNNVFYWNCIIIKLLK